MEGTFNNGDYEEHIDMVNSTKGLLDQSLLLRNVQDKIDSKIDAIKAAGSNNYDHLVILLAVPLFLLLAFVNYKFLLSWRIIPLVVLIIFVVYYKIISKKQETNRNSNLKDKHDEGPRPLKYLDMKLDYLSSLMNTRFESLKNVRFFYMTLFPFLCYFVYEVAMSTTPFDSMWIGLAVAFVISGFFWFFYFNGEFDKMWFHKKQLSDYRSLIAEHQKSLLPISEEE